MKIRKYITMLLGLLICYGCSDDNKTLSPSWKDIDWYRIEDGSDPTDHLRYEIYRDYDISVFYNDTLGNQHRGVNGYGDEVIHYEKIDPFYSITANDDKKSYALSTSKTDIHNGVVLFKERVLPGLLSWMYPRCVLLVRELRFDIDKTEAAGNREESVYQSLRATVIGRLNTISAMSEEELTIYANEVKAAIWYAHAMTMFVEELEFFFQVSDRDWVPSTTSPSVYYQNMSSASVNFKPHWNGLGFLISSAKMPNQLFEDANNPGSYTRYFTPDRDEDAVSFFNAVMNYTEAQFTATYGDVDGYVLLLEKFRKINSIVAEMKTIV